jgi:thioredoxin-like negative regulator of GroEL
MADLTPFTAEWFDANAEHRGYARSRAALETLPLEQRARAWHAATTAVNLEGGTASGWVPQMVDAIAANPDAETWSERIAREWLERHNARRAYDDGCALAAHLSRFRGTPEGDARYLEQVAANRALSVRAFGH